jgi:hypothetical protein
MGIAKEAIRDLLQSLLIAQDIPKQFEWSFRSRRLSIVWRWLRTRQRCIRSVNLFVNLLCGQSVRVGIVPLFQVYLVVAPLFFLNRFFPGLIGLLRVLPVRLPARIVVWFLFAHGSIRRPTIKMSRAVCATDGSIIWLVAIKTRTFDVVPIFLVICRLRAFPAATT